MESTLRKTALVAAKTSPKAETILFWIVTALFCLQMSFTAYAEVRLPQVAEAFTHLGFPASYFRAELSWAKLLGVVLLLAPAPARRSFSSALSRAKEWAYAGFAIVGLGGRHQCALGILLLPMAPPADHARERLTAHNRLFRSR